MSLLGFQHRTRLSFAAVSKRSESCGHQARERIPFLCRSRVLIGDVANLRSQSFVEEREEEEK